MYQRQIVCHSFIDLRNFPDTKISIIQAPFKCRKKKKSARLTYICQNFLEYIHGTYTRSTDALLQN